MSKNGVVLEHCDSEVKFVFVEAHRYTDGEFRSQRVNTSKEPSSRLVRNYFSSPIELHTIKELLEYPSTYFNSKLPTTTLMSHIQRTRLHVRILPRPITPALFFFNSLRREHGWNVDAIFIESLDAISLQIPVGPLIPRSL